MQTLMIFWSSWRLEMVVSERQQSPRKKQRVIFTKGSQTRTSGYPFSDAFKDVVRRMIILNTLMYSWMRNLRLLLNLLSLFFNLKLILMIGWWFLIHVPDTPVLFPGRPDLRPRVSGLISGVFGMHCGMCSWWTWKHHPILILILLFLRLYLSNS